MSASMHIVRTALLAVTLLSGWAAHAEALFAGMIKQQDVRLPSQRRYEARAMTESSGHVDVASDILAIIREAAG